MERSGDDQPIRPENFKELKQAPKKPVSVSENLFDTEPISAQKDSSDKEQDSARKDSINEAPVSHEEAQLPQETPASGEIQLLQETQLQQGVKLPRQVQLRQTVQSSNELPSASEPQSQRESQPAEAASVPSEKDLHIQSAACPEKKEPAFLPFGEPFCPFPEGDSVSLLENPAAGFGSLSKKTMRASKQPLFTVWLLQFRSFAVMQKS